MANSIFDFCGIWSLFANPVTNIYIINSLSNTHTRTHTRTVTTTKSVGFQAITIA